jgi:hypothetical protein
MSCSLLAFYLHHVLWHHFLLQLIRMLDCQTTFLDFGNDIYSTQTYPSASDICLPFPDEHHQSLVSITPHIDFLGRYEDGIIGVS